MHIHCAVVVHIIGSVQVFVGFDVDDADVGGDVDDVHVHVLMAVVMRMLSG